MVKTIFHSFAALIREILFSPLEDKIHIFAPPCNILYILLYILLYKNINIFISLYICIVSIMVAVINWGYALYGHLLLIIKGNKVIKTNKQTNNGEELLQACISSLYLY